MTLESDVLACFVRKRHGEDAGQSLCLMDDSISEGQILPVLKLHWTTSYHPAQLLLDLVWKRGQFFFKVYHFMMHLGVNVYVWNLFIHSSLPCIFGYFAISRSAHLSVDAVVSVPAANR